MLASSHSVIEIGVVHMLPWTTALQLHNHSDASIWESKIQKHQPTGPPFSVKSIATILCFRRMTHTFDQSYSHADVHQEHVMDAQIL